VSQVIAGLLGWLLATSASAILIFGFLVILLRCPSGQHGVIERQEG
jgi:hypothetical protein